MTIELTGEYTTATILIDDEGLIESNCIEQIQQLIDHPAFTEPVRIMPDTHVGSGAPIGFTMPLPDRVVPNIVGVDVGCGMVATKLGSTLPLSGSEREQRVRDVIPMGYDVHNDADAIHLIDEFPFEQANSVFRRFEQAYKDEFGQHINPLGFDFDGYDSEYFKSLCQRVLANQRQGMGHVIRSAGTLGGGNHFIEFAKARDSGDYWLVIHSGSRYLGKSIAEYWQQHATQYRQADDIRDILPSKYHEYLKFDPETVSNGELYTWVTGGMGESHLRKESIRRDFDGKEITEVFNILSRPHSEIDDQSNDLDWLDGREAHGYYIDMLFAQQYARWNRQLMSKAICETLQINPDRQFQSIHNYIDFRDLMIRKGATPAREDQELIIPLNMAEGSILARGQGVERFHQTAPHGAGRIMSRRQAHNEGSLEAFADAMDGIYSESVVESVLDEAPMAYKPTEAIVDAIEPTAEIVDWLEVIHNLKAN